MKKEVIKPFDLEAYKNGAKVKTRNGHEVRIICTDAKCVVCFPIIALVEIDGSTEVVMRYTSEGEIDAGDISANDLVIVEEVEEPEFWSDKEDKQVKGWLINFESNIIFHTSTPYYHRQHKYFASRKQAKSALAMAMISQIMANDIEHFGGAIADVEWLETSVKSTIYRAGSKIELGSTVYEYRFLAFHTAAQRDLFLEKYRDLVKDYLCLD